MNRNYEDPEYLIALIKANYFTREYESAITIAESLLDKNEYWMALYLKAAAFYADGKIRETYQSLVAAAIRDRAYFLVTIQDMGSNGYFIQEPNQKPEAMILDVLIRDGPTSAAPLLETLVLSRPDEHDFSKMLVILCIINVNYVDALKFSEQPYNDDTPESNLIRVYALRVAGCMQEAEEMGREILLKNPTSLPSIISLYQGIN